MVALYDVYIILYSNGQGLIVSYYQMGLEFCSVVSSYSASSTRLAGTSCQSAGLCRGLD